MTHTEGPWQLSSIPFEMRNTDSAAAIYGPCNRDGGACYIAEISRSPGDEQATANAKLIAAAPYLLEALIEAVSTIELMRDNPVKHVSKASVNMSLATINKAIQKATK